MLTSSGVDVLSVCQRSKFGLASSATRWMVSRLWRGKFVHEVDGFEALAGQLCPRDEICVIYFFVEIDDFHSFPSKSMIFIVFHLKSMIFIVFYLKS